MQKDLDEDRRWFSQQDYLQGLAFCQLSPGPLAAQLATYLGWLRSGILGASLAGIAFIVPSFLMAVPLAEEGALYGGKVKTEDSRARIPIPQRVRPYIEAWRQVCPDTSPDAVMFPTSGHLRNKGKAVPFRAQNFFKWKVWPTTDNLGIPRNLCTFQVFRRTLARN